MLATIAAAATLAMAIAFLGCARPPSVASVSPGADNVLLAELAREDQAVRRGGSAERDDVDRARLVIAEIGADRLRTSVDRTNAALVLQHSPLTIRDGVLVAISPHDYLLAHHLALRAYRDGHAAARYLVAQTIDRFLTFTAGYQKYGTNRLINQETGREELVPIDRSTTDAERAEFGVPPLAELLKQYPEAPRRVPPE